MRKMVRRTLLVVLALSIVMLTSYARAQAPANVGGTWTGHTTQGTRPMTLVLKQDGQNVTGTLSGAGTDDGPVEGTVDGDTIRLKNRTGATPVLNIKGDQISGMLSGTGVTLNRSK